MMNMIFYENGNEFVKEESYAWNEKEIYASDHLIGKRSFQEIKELSVADIDVNKEIEYVNIVKNLVLIVFEKDNLNNGEIQFLLYSVDGRFLHGYQITPKNAARIQVGILIESKEICIFDPKFGYDYNDGKIRYGVTIIKNDGTISYGYFYDDKALGWKAYTVSLSGFMIKEIKNGKMIIQESETGKETVLFE